MGELEGNRSKILLLNRVVERSLRILQGDVAEDERPDVVAVSVREQLRRTEVHLLLWKSRDLLVHALVELVEHLGDEVLRQKTLLFHVVQSLFQGLAQSRSSVQGVRCHVCKW